MSDKNLHFTENLDIVLISEGKKQVEELMKAADKQDPEAVLSIGLLLFHGNSTKALQMIGEQYYQKNIEKADVSLAFEWIADAADLGNVKAAYYAGAMLQELNGTVIFGREKDMKKYLKLAAKQGNQRAEERLKNKINQPLDIVVKEGEHLLDVRLFRKICLPWLLLALFPSLCFNAIMIYATIYDIFIYKAGIGKTLGIFLIFAFFNFMLFQFIFIEKYKNLRELRMSGRVITNDSNVTYLQFKLFYIKKEDLTDFRCSEFKVEKVEEVKLRKNGSIVIHGDILEKQYKEYEYGKKPILLEEKHNNKLVIPSYYQDINKVFNILVEMKNQPNSHK